MTASNKLRENKRAIGNHVSGDGVTYNDLDSAIDEGIAAAYKIFDAAIRIGDDRYKEAYEIGLALKKLRSPEVAAALAAERLAKVRMS
ncbi:hypothetical protein E4T66_13595 [Sinimarinibacterium sp. CAU 1509]|uniref:hypothetical protein n=1 Tax=Sinimarinibacterium sp. CAU 1509 TaxID=2562283 RepID=UPI0010AC96ED|nr:hypothetical protein [Sinimarinibacterium sp. CAU 1509]TJY59419.1 hypothetical protein E4T66_13595 [Sinimarinibacterium sp. CAU 1509]